MIGNTNTHLTTDKLQLLSRLALFDGLNPRGLQDLSRSTTLTRVAKGHSFFRPEEASRQVYIMLEGHVHLYRISPGGKKLIVDTLGPQSVFDDMALLCNSTHQSFAEAAEDSLVLVMDCLDLERLMLRNPRIELRILDGALSRLNALEEKIESFAFQTLEVRISALLLRLTQERNSTSLKGVTHNELAESLGTYRETATQVLNQLRSQGCITIRRKRIDILDVSKLADISGRTSNFS